MAEISDPNDLTWASYVLYGDPNNSYFEMEIDKYRSQKGVIAGYKDALNKGLGKTEENEKNNS